MQKAYSHLVWVVFFFTAQDQFPLCLKTCHGIDAELHRINQISWMKVLLKT